MTDEGFPKRPVPRRTYLKALRHIHPADYFDRDKRLVDVIGRITARRVEKNPGFIGALKNGKMRLAGVLWHSAAKKVMDHVARRLRVNFAGEKTIQSGRSGSRADVLSVNKRFEVDWKPHVKAALRSIGQMKRHAQAFEKAFGRKLKVQESRNWTDYSRQTPRAGKYLRVIERAQAAKRSRVVARKVQAKAGNATSSVAANRRAAPQATSPTGTNAAKAPPQTTADRPAKSARPKPVQSRMRVNPLRTKSAPSARPKHAAAKPDRARLRVNPAKASPKRAPAPKAAPAAPDRSKLRVDGAHAKALAGNVSKPAAPKLVVQPKAGARPTGHLTPSAGPTSFGGGE
jgi:hypothetical protein